MDTAIYKPLVRGLTGSLVMGDEGGTPTPPAFLGTVTISGDPTVTKTLTANSGPITGYPTPVRSYQWKNGGVDIPGATMSTYVLQASDEGDLISVEITITNSEGSASQESAQVGPIAPYTEAPSFGGTVSISGTPVVGNTLTGNTGTPHNGTPAPTPTYEWLRNGSPIAGATSATYDLVQADADANITFRVTLTNSEGSVNETSAAVGPVEHAPVITTAVTISGTALVGNTLTAGGGVVTGDPTPSVTYQWKRGGVNIGGATNSTYMLVAADAGTVITVEKTATNVHGSDSDTSAGTDPVEMPPSIDGTVQVTGSTTVGSLLTCSDGTPYSGYPAPSASYQWYRNTNTPIGGATSSTYTLQAGDEGDLIACEVTVTNVRGSDSVKSANVGPITSTGEAPTFGGTVSISGTTRVGETLTGDAGTPHNGNPAPTPSYEWLRNGTPIAGANAITYELVGADEGTNISFRVTLTNSEGTADQTSSAVGPIDPALAAPTFGGSVSISGTALVGQTLTGGTGTPHNGNPAPSASYEWLRNGTPIAGATNTTYTLVEADEDANITFRVTLTNSEGSANQTSSAAGPVEHPAEITGSVSIDGVITVPSILTVNTTSAGVTGRPTPSLSYQWKRDGVNISGETGTTYTLQVADVNTMITCEVTATNTHGSDSATTPGVGPIQQSPTFSGTVTVSGTTTEGETLTGGTGTPYNGFPAPTATYEWLRDGSPISGATATTYVLVSDDVGAMISFRVTITNAAGSANQTSTAVGPIVASGGGGPFEYSDVFPDTTATGKGWMWHSNIGAGGAYHGEGTWAEDAFNRQDIAKAGDTVEQLSDQKWLSGGILAHMATVADTADSAYVENPANWTGTATVTAPETGVIRCTYGGNANGAELDLRDATDPEWVPTDWDVAHAKFEYRVNAPGSPVGIEMDAEFNGLFLTQETDWTVGEVYGGARINAYLGMTSMASGDWIEFRNVEFRFAQQMHSFRIREATEADEPILTKIGTKDGNDVFVLSFDGLSDQLGPNNSGSLTDVLPTGSCSIFISFRAVGSPSSFILFSQDTNGTNWGPRATDGGTGAITDGMGTPTFYLDKVLKSWSNDGDAYTDMVDGKWHVIEIRDANISGWNDFGLSTYAGELFPGDIGHLFIVPNSQELTDNRDEMVDQMMDDITPDPFDYTSLFPADTKGFYVNATRDGFIYKENDRGSGNLAEPNDDGRYWTCLKYLDKNPHTEYVNWTDLWNGAGENPANWDPQGNNTVTAPVPGTIRIAYVDASGGADLHFNDACTPYSPETHKSWYFRATVQGDNVSNSISGRSSSSSNLNAYAGDSFGNYNEYKNAADEIGHVGFGSGEAIEYSSMQVFHEAIGSSYGLKEVTSADRPQYIEEGGIRSVAFDGLSDFIGYNADGEEQDIQSDDCSVFISFKGAATQSSNLCTLVDGGALGRILDAEQGGGANVYTVPAASGETPALLIDNLTPTGETQDDLFDYIVEDVWHVAEITHLDLSTIAKTELIVGARENSSRHFGGNVGHLLIVPSGTTLDNARDELVMQMLRDVGAL